MKKKIKKYAGGGLAGISQEANSLMGQVDNVANSIKYGSGGGGSNLGSGLGFNSQKANMLNVDLTSPQSIDPTAVFPNPTQGLRSGNPDMYNQLLTQQKGFASQLSGLANSGKSISFKKGGKVSSASKRADGIAIRGKTRA